MLATLPPLHHTKHGPPLVSLHHPLAHNYCSQHICDSKPYVSKIIQRNVNKLAFLHIHVSNQMGSLNKAMVSVKMYYYFETMYLPEINVECYLDPKVPRVVHYHFLPQNCHSHHPLLVHALQMYHKMYHLAIQDCYKQALHHYHPLFLFWWSLVYRHHSGNLTILPGGTLSMLQLNWRGLRWLGLHPVPSRHLVPPSARLLAWVATLLASPTWAPSPFAPPAPTWPALPPSLPGMLPLRR
jgi:hypothetical protein